MEYTPLDYESLGKTFDFGRPNRLSILVHPGWDYRFGASLLPLWRDYANLLAADNNHALLIIQGYGPETIQKQKEYNVKIRDWIVQLSILFGSRLAIYDKGLLPNDEAHRDWLMEKLGNPVPVTHRNPVNEGVKKVANFFTIDFSGIYYDTCVAWQKESFPCSSVWSQNLWNIWH